VLTLRLNLRPHPNGSTDIYPWNTPPYWPLHGKTPTPDARLPRETPSCGIGSKQRIMELRATHQRAYAAGRHAEVIRITVELNALRGLVTKRAVDLRDDTQRDHDDAQRDHDWSVR
jgi:hypothetical protein